MAIPDAGTVAAKWVTRTSAAAQDYADGVATTDKDPTQLAIAAIPRMRTNIIAAIDSGKVANGLRAVGKLGWQQAVRDKGVANFSTGVQAAEQKVATAFGPLLAFESQLQSRINSMPNVTDADRKARMNAWFDGMLGYSG
jgi:hypothetical protein